MSKIFHKNYEKYKHKYYLIGKKERKRWERINQIVDNLIKFKEYSYVD